MDAEGLWVGVANVDNAVEVRQGEPAGRLAGREAVAKPIQRIKACGLRVKDVFRVRR